MMTTRILTTLLALALSVPLFAAERYQVIVNAANPVSSISKATIRNYFFGKATRWPDGSAVKPIDLPMSSEVRAAFSKVVLGKSTEAVRSYWLTMVFAGRGVPPLQLDSDEKIISAVRASSDAIGYVSATASLGSGVKAVSVTD